jgi:predicted transcriptional regulator
MIPTGEQIRAARALLRMEQAALAAAAGVSLESVKRLEKMRGPVRANIATVEKLVIAFRQAGAVFVEADDNGGPGVRLRRNSPAR